MDETELTQRLHDLQRSMEDGDDLARAISLIGDALERRMARIRDRIEALEGEVEAADGERLRTVINRVAATLDTYEESIQLRHARMAELIGQFQDSLGDQATQLEQLEEKLESAD